MTLRDCTKEELISIIETVRDTGDAWRVERALIDIAYRREQAKIDAADAANKEAAEKRGEAIELLAPYAGKRLSDIPPDVVKKASALVDAADAADARWDKLMGMKPPKEAGSKRR